MIIRITNKRIIIFTLVISVLAGIFTLIIRYDWALNDVSYNNFLFIHDDDINSVGFHTLISVMNVILLFPFAMEMLTDHKKTNEIYIVSRMSNSIRFYFIKFLQMALLCFLESLFYNTALLTFYCSVGKIAEPGKQLISIYLYTVIVNFLITLTFIAIMQLLSIIINEKIALVLIIVFFCICVTCGLKITNRISNICITNYYFITLTFTNNPPSLNRIALSLALPLIITSSITVSGSFLYKHTDHL